MDVLDMKQKQLLKALGTLEDSLKLLEKITLQTVACGNEYSREQLYLAFKDSVIQRFEFCSELFWKYVKIYLEHITQSTEYNAPIPVIRHACAVGVLPEEDAELALLMIKDRNRTSHIYKQEIAQDLEKKIPEYFKLMRNIVLRLKSI